jgi:hypothetical protein
MDALPGGVMFRESSRAPVAAGQSMAVRNPVGTQRINCELVYSAVVDPASSMFKRGVGRSGMGSAALRPGFSGNRVPL